MRRSLWVKLPALVLACLALAFGHGLWAWLLAASVVVVGVAILAALVFHPNAAFWAPLRFRAEGAPNTVALTFDDGPDPTFTPAVLQILAEKAAPATFFVVGQRVEAHGDVLAAIDAQGHLVGNHTYRHDLTFHFRLWRSVREELRRCDAAIDAAIGKKPRFFRSPQGFKNPALGDVLHEEGLLAVGWQARGLDAVGASAVEIERRILTSLRPGGVIVMHDGAGLHGSDDRTPTLTALPRIIDAIRARGLRIVPLDELLQHPAYRS